MAFFLVLLVICWQRPYVILVLGAQYKWSNRDIPGIPVGQYAPGRPSFFTTSSCRRTFRTNVRWILSQSTFKNAKNLFAHTRFRVKKTVFSLIRFICGRATRVNRGKCYISLTTVRDARLLSNDVKPASSLVREWKTKRYGFTWKTSKSLLRVKGKEKTG